MKNESLSAESAYEIGYDDGYNKAIEDFKYKFQGYIAEAIHYIKKDISHE